jgi:hypothetical protein
MRKRDLDILNSLEKFKVLSRNQIAALHFNINSNPIISCNRVLKRLRDTGYILANTDRSFQQYLYFLNPSPMKTDSQKIDHYLMIAQGYIDLNKISPVTQYEIEQKMDNVIPDVKAQWQDKLWYIEFQNSLYTQKQMYTKLDRYLEYFNERSWKDERILIVGRTNLKLETEVYPFKIKQIKNISELKELVWKRDRYAREQQVIKSSNGKIVWEQKVT